MSIDIDEKSKNTKREEKSISNLSINLDIEEKENLWNDDSKLEDIVKIEYEKQKIPKEDLEKDLQKLKENRIYYLSQWKKLTEEDKKIFPLGLRKILDE